MTRKRKHNIGTSVKVVSLRPKNLKREISTPSQRNYAEGTIIYGEEDALPLKIANAVDRSPAASACISTISKYIKGVGFSNKELEKIKIDENGTTLWDFHCGLADSLALFWGFSVNLQYNDEQKITNAYQMSFESVRFVKPADKSPYIKKIKYNPYFGTTEYRSEYTKEYPIYDSKELYNQMTEYGNEFCGQVYYCGKTSPLYRFYPVPGYWSAKDWIQVDGQIQEFNREDLENGFFQSVLINAIGNPSEWSKNPRLQEEYTKEDGTKGRRGKKTVGEEFSDEMSENFSGSKKAGTAMVLWSLNSDMAIKLQPFPSGGNAERFLALQDQTTKNITIATQVPSILANISEGSNLGSGGSEIQKAIELMQSNTYEWRAKLESFYNEILLPNLAVPVLEKVVIKNFNPVSQKVEVEDKFWDVLNDVEKRSFIRKNFPNIEILEAPINALGAPGTSTTADAQVNEVMKNLTGRQLQNIQRVVRKFNKGELTKEQAAGLLKNGFAFTDADVEAWLITTEEE